MRVKKSAILLILVFLVLTGRNYSQEISVEILSLEDLLNLEVSVASKSNETTLDAPSSVTVFSETEINNMGITTLDELLNFVPGFQVTRDIEQGTANRFSARGRSSALSESILFLVNGNRINDLYTGGVSILNRRIPLSNIKQIEVIRGPGSALYGSNAFLGVVNIVTKTDENSVYVNFGENNYTEAAVNIGKTFDNGVDLQAFLQISKDNGYEFNNLTDQFGFTSDTQDPYTAQDAYVSLGYKDFEFSMRYMHRRASDFMTFGSISNNLNDENTYQTAFNLKYNKKISDVTTITTGAGYSFDKWNTKALLIAKDIEIAPGFALSENFNGGPLLESYNFNLYADLVFEFSNNKLIAGVQLENTGINEATNIMTHHPIDLTYNGYFKEYSGSLSFNKDETRTILGVYAQNDFHVSDALSLVAGVRYDNYNDFGSSLNPRAAAIYKFPFKGTIKVMYGKAFRAPNFLELYDKNNPVDFGNSDLDAEKVQTIEFSYIQTFDKLQLTSNFFYNKIEDIITLSAPVDHPDNPLGAPGFVNAGELETKGLEFELKASPVKNILIHASYTHFFDGDDLSGLNHDGLQVSHDFASFIINGTFGKFNINLSGIYRSEMPLFTTQESYFVFYSSVKYTLMKNFNLKFNVKNLFDEEYGTYTNMPIANNYVTNRGRQFYAGIEIKF